MDLFEFLYNRYGVNEPIFLEDLRKEIDFMKPDALRQSLKRMVDNGKIRRFRDGIYFIPNPNSLLKTTTLSVNKIINKKYLYRNDERIGYLTGLTFANILRLTTQNPGNIEVVTTTEKSTIRVVEFDTRKVTLRKPRVDVNEENYKILQILDLLTNFEKLSVKPLKDSVKNILGYLDNTKVTKDELNQYLKNYPNKTYAKLFESELYNEITQK